MEENKNNEEDVVESVNDLKFKLDEATKELEKFKNKDINFSKVKEQTEKEKAKYEEEKKTLQQQIDELKTSVSERDAKMIVEWKGTAIRSLVGSDAENIKAIEAEYELLNMPIGNRDEVHARVLKAVKLAGYEVSGDTASISVGSSREPERKPKSYSETEKGKETAKFFAPHLFKDNK